MRARLVVAATVVVAALVSASLAIGAKPTATGYTLRAALNIGQEKPIAKGAKRGASGRFTATLSGAQLTWKLTFAHLSGPATMAHIHIAPRGKPGPIVVTLCTPCTSPATGVAALTTDQVKDLLAGKDYVNVHTDKNPAGEIRGQITKSPVMH
jgi:hypothetical protein